MGMSGGFFENVAWVRLGQARSELPDGGSLTVGRRSTCDIRVGAATPGPENLGVSRQAATLTYGNDRPWVGNHRPPGRCSSGLRREWCTCFGAGT
ncbi:MAG TPA: hypothetical protein VET24_17055 [Actinomycetota bacterium]|nr:hypothetical protein [Actinomycetota bacterium]